MAARVVRSRAQYEDPVQLADLLHRLTRRLRRSQAERLAPLGLTPAQERALRLITRSDEPPRMTELADRLGIVPRSLTTVIDALEDAGLVRREIDPRNRRAILLRLTDHGAPSAPGHSVLVLKYVVTGIEDPCPWSVGVPMV